MKTPFTMLLLWMAIPALPALSVEITLGSLLREMTDYAEVARWPEPEFTCKQASSYDRGTVAPDKPGWFANSDQNQFIRTEENRQSPCKIFRFPPLFLVESDMRTARFTSRRGVPPGYAARWRGGRRSDALWQTPFLWLDRGVFDMEEDMASSEFDSASVSPQAGRFPPTHWSMVLNAGKDSSPDAREAFGRLYQLYQPPLRAFLRREGRSPHEAEDLVQGFFEFLIEKRSLGRVRPEGKFRCWLLVSLKHYLSDVWDKARAVKRGGDQPHVALVGDEEEPKLDPPDSGRTPEEEYDHEFALQFLDAVMGRLQEEYRISGKERIFMGLRPLLLDKKGTISHAERGQPLGMSANAVTTEVSRMRKRYREIFDRELEKLLGDADELEAEKRFLFASLSK